MASHLIYHLDDDPFYLEEFREMIQNTSSELRLRSFESSKTMMQALGVDECPALVVLDIHLSADDELDGQHLVSLLRSRYPQILIVMCSDRRDSLTVEQSLLWGADDFIFKGMGESDLAKRLVDLLAVKAQHLQKGDANEKMVTPCLAAIQQRIPNILHSAITAVHVYGESGTGKELVSELFEQALPAGTPFNRIHCGAISPTLLESELFGHMKGAFTGAQSHKRGLIEQADGGWIFLDEVATLSPSAQVALLRVLENQQIRPVGASQEKKVSIKVISATNESLAELVEKGRFRADLWQRLCEASIELAPLRDRMEELEEIAKFFCARMAFGPYRISGETLEILKRYDWRRGNVRELRNCLRAMTEGAVNRVLTPASIPKHIWRAIQQQDADPGDSSDSLLSIGADQWQRGYEYCSQYLLAAMIKKQVSQDVRISLRQLAISLQIPRTTLGNYIKKLYENDLLDETTYALFFK